MITQYHPPINNNNNNNVIIYYQPKDTTPYLCVKNKNNINIYSQYDIVYAN